MADDQPIEFRGPIVFYDGECGLCDRFVQFLIRLDKGGRLRFATLQGETATRLLEPMAGDAGSQTMRYLDERGVHVRSTAALQAVARTGGFASLALALLLIPRPVRDSIYRGVAKNRYRWSRNSACLIPTRALRERFLP